MKDIIEKLGITPIEDEMMYTTFGYDLGRYIETAKVREVEQQRNEMLDYLINNMLERIELWIDTSNDRGDSESIEEITIQCEQANHVLIKIIEKADPQHRLWEEIKELL